MTTTNTNTTNPITQQSSLRAINGRIANIAKVAGKLNVSIHETAILVMQHSHAFGDCSAAARLVDAMPMSHRRGLLIKWFKTYSPISVAKSDKTKAIKAHLSGKAEERTWRIDEAKANPFFSMTGIEDEPDMPSYESIHNNVVSYLERMKKMTDKIENATDKARALEELAKLKTALAA